MDGLPDHRQGGPALAAQSAGALTLSAQEVADAMSVNVAMADRLSADRGEPVAWDRFDGFDARMRPAGWRDRREPDAADPHDDSTHAVLPLPQRRKSGEVPG